MSNAPASSGGADPAFATAERVSMWTQPQRGPAPFTAWHDALRTAFEVPQDEFELPPEPAIDIEAEREQAFALGYEEGFAAGRAEADAERAELRALAASLAALRPEPVTGLGAMIAATVERLVGEVMGQVTIDRDTLVARAEAAAALIADEGRPAVLKLNPADAARLAGVALPVAMETDAALAPGALRLETANGCIEDSPALRLERLKIALDRVAAAR